MANANRPQGFVPYMYLNGANWTGQARIYSIAAAYGTALAVGDPVISSGTSDALGIQGIALGATTGALRGVIAWLGTSPNGYSGGANLNINNPNSIVRPASDPALWYAAVVDDPNVIFLIQEESNGTQLAAADIGLNTISKTGTNGGYVSGWQLPSATGATPNTTATLQLRLLGLAQYPVPVGVNGNTFGAYAKHLVQINVHELGHGTGAAGV